MKRLALYVFFEKDGTVRDFNEYYLRELKKVCQDVLVVVNGKLSVSSRKRLEKIPVGILMRENKGFDFSGWKDAIEKIGYTGISQYDELVLCNCSCYGPVGSFDSLFEEMFKSNCDFWGLYRHPASKEYYEETMRCPEHLQSYFLVVRKRLLSSREFWKYWNDLTVARNWKEAVKQEISFTEYFEDAGFSSCAYSDSSLCEWTLNPAIYHPSGLLEKGFPLVKRKLFSEDYDIFLYRSNGSQAKETLEYLKGKTNYPVEYIYSDLLATLPGSVLRNSLHLTFSLQDDVAPERSKEILNTTKVAVIVFSYYEDLMEEDISYINNMPPTSDVFVVTPLTDLAGKWEEKKSSLMGRKVDVRVQENRGRNENAYWLTCRDVIENYDLICVVHDKKTPSARPPLLGRYYSLHCWKNVLKSREYVEQIICLMVENPRLGILMPPAPLFSNLSDILNNEWLANRDVAREIYDRLELKIPFDESPLAPWGAMFWLRGKAMSPFYRYDWSVEDFPMEPIKKTDGTILHAMERMYCMIAQEAGYFSAWVMPASEMGVHYDNLYYQLREAKKVEQEGFVIDENSIRFSTLKRMAKAYWKRKMKKWKL